MPRKKLPNIILIVLDTARAKSFSCYGYQRKTTPNIDRIAEEGVLYKWCFSPANWTIPSHASIFTGLYPSEHRCHVGNPFLDENIPTLAELLSSIGYRTVGISCNGLISKFYGFQRGFDRFYELWTLFPDLEPLSAATAMGKIASLFRLVPIDPALATKYVVRSLWRRFKGDVLENSTPYTLRALKLARKVLGEVTPNIPFFLFVNIMQTHCRYNPPGRTRGYFSSSGYKYQDLLDKPSRWYLKSFEPFVPPEQMWKLLIALYDEELLFADWCIGELYDFLKHSGILDSAFLVITSDHGELIGEHNLCDHMFSLYNELIHVPLIVRYPGSNQNIIANHIVQTNDLLSTIGEIVEIPYPTPDSSISLCSTNKRCWAQAQDLDSLADVLALRQREPDWSSDSWWCSPSIAVIDPHLLKLISPSNMSHFYFCLNQDYEEHHPQPLSTVNNDIVKLVEKIKIRFKWDNAVRSCEESISSLQQGKNTSFFVWV